MDKSASRRRSFLIRNFCNCFPRSWWQIRRRPASTIPRHPLHACARMNTHMRPGMRAQTRMCARLCTCADVCISVHVHVCTCTDMYTSVAGAAHALRGTTWQRRQSAASSPCSCATPVQPATSSGPPQATAPAGRPAWASSHRSAGARPSQALGGRGEGCSAAAPQCGGAGLPMQWYYKFTDICVTL